MLQTAAKKNYPPAVYKVATNLLMAVQRGETTENVSAIRELLKIAGRTIPSAKLDLANCMAVGCDGHPADARRRARSASTPPATASPLRSVDGAHAVGRAHAARAMLAWQYFGDRLNEGGCMGDQYVPTTLAFGQTIGLLERVLEPTGLEARASGPKRSGTSTA